MLSDRSDPPSGSILLMLIGVVVALGVLGSFGWRLAGGSLFTIATPSMCPDLCVGTLVVDQPVHGPVHRGEVVTFHPPGTTTVFTHRVVKVLPGGSFETAGDALGKIDPWTVPPGNVLGRVVANVRGLGWLWRGLPWMGAGLACILVVRRRVPARWRGPSDLVGVSLLVVVPVLLMRPLVRASVISWHLRRGGAMVMTIANTGLLPAQYHLTGVPAVGPVGPGQIVTVTGAGLRGGAASLRDTASFSTWQWVIAALVVLLPAVGLLGRLVMQRLRWPALGLSPAMAAPSHVSATPSPPRHVVRTRPPPRSEHWRGPSPPEPLR